MATFHTTIPTKVVLHNAIHTLLMHHSIAQHQRMAKKYIHVEKAHGINNEMGGAIYPCMMCLWLMSRLEHKQPRTLTH